MKIISFYNSNIPDKVVQAQKSVFEKFGYNIEQVLTNLQHPDAIDVYLDTQDWERVAIFDIDCIPLSKEALMDIEIISKAPVVYGAAQKASHVKGSEIYVSPAFIVFNRETFERLGKPSFVPKRSDVGSEITYVANELKVPVVYIYPSHVQVPKWELRPGEKFGLGTTYGNKIYHAFESRMNNGNMFIEKCCEVLK